MLRVVDLAAGQAVTPPPDMLQLRYLREFGLPPRAGGQNDQPAGFFRRALYLERIYQLMWSYYHDPHYQIGQADRELFQMIKRLIAARKRETQHVR